MIAEPPVIPPHAPIVVCPACSLHTAHRMVSLGQYTCLICDTTHPLVPMRKAHAEPDLVWCPTCREANGSPVWAQVRGRRQCRVCQQWIAVANEQAQED